MVNGSVDSIPQLSDINGLYLLRFTTKIFCITRYGYILNITLYVYSDKLLELHINIFITIDTLIKKTRLFNVNYICYPYPVSDKDPSEGSFYIYTEQVPVQFISSESLFLLSLSLYMQGILSLRSICKWIYKNTLDWQELDSKVSLG